MIINNIYKVLKPSVWLVGTLFGIALLAIPRFSFTDSVLIIWNLGYSFYIFEITLWAIIAVLFGLFLWSTVYKINFFKWWKSWVGLFGWLLGILVTWCPSCSITLASYIWLAGILSILPFYWLELKFLSVFLLIYANYSTLKTLELCAVKINTNSEK